MLRTAVSTLVPYTTLFRSEKSSREVVVALSPKGRALVQRLIPIAVKLERKASAGLSAKDLAALKSLLSRVRSEEHTSELQSPCNLVCRLLLEKKKRASSEQ